MQALSLCTMQIVCLQLYNKPFINRTAHKRYNQKGVRKMSARFKVKHVYITTSAATCNDHNGLPYTNMDFPKGTIYAEDANGDIFYERTKLFDEIHLPFDEMKKVYKSKHFYRDYWRHVAPAKDAPYTKALLNASKEQLA